MTGKIIPALEEQRRDALVSYYLGQVVPSDDTSAPLGLTTPEDLYEYMLIDNQVSGEVETSRVAQGIASIQQYINAIYNGMEPGYAGGFDDERLKLWREGMSEYSVWAGYQMIEDYPENYIDPTLRLNKTSQFQTFESELGQSRINEDSVRAALKTYLDNFEIVSNLKVVACYIDGQDFRQANYYFVGRQNVEPFGYYWRVAKMDLREDSTQVLPSAWSEWKTIDVACDTKVQHVRPVVVEGRLHFVWVESGQPEVDDSGQKTGKYFYRAKMSYKQISDSWSPPTLLYEGLTDKQSLDALTDISPQAGRFTLVAVMDARFVGESRLVVCFQYKASLAGAFEPFDAERFVRVYDRFFNRITVDSAEEEQYYAVATSLLGSNPARGQYPLTGKYGTASSEWELESVVWNRDGANDIAPGGINQSLELDAVLRSSEAECLLEVQGSCREKRHCRSQFSVSLFSWRVVDNCQYRVLVEGGHEKLQMKITLFAGTDSVPPEAKGVLSWNGNEVQGFAPEDFGQSSSTGFNNMWQATWVLPIDPEEFPTLTEDEVLGGAGFVLEMPGGPLPLANSSNFYSETWAPAEVGCDIWISQPRVSSTLVLNGDARTPVEQVAWTGMDPVMTLYFGALPEGSGFGYNEFTIRRAMKSIPVPLIVSSQEGGQFLDLAALEIPSLRYVRMNTTFASELVKKAERSLSSVLSWEVQHTQEPPEPDGVSVPLDFKGANGRYFWELFFHVPHLVAHRLHTEFNYLQAENWLHYLFNPLERIAPLYPPPVADHSYWTSRPLTFADDPAYEWGGLGDPDAIAYGAPSHYRKAIFVAYLNNLIAHGDMLYRQLTRDTLNHAQLLYARAGSLLGPLSKGRSISRWTPMTLQEAAAQDESVFADFEAFGLEVLEHDVPSRTEGQLWLHLLDAPWFRLPVNARLLDLWEKLALRLYNLRHNLSLDGKPLSLPLYAPAANPTDLLRAQAAGGGSGQRRLGSLAIIPPYRFRAMLPRVQNAVETLIRYGEQLRGYMELRDRADQEELQQAHVLELSAFTETLQSQMIEQAVKSCEALAGSRAAIESRKFYYRQLEKEDVSWEEKDALHRQYQSMCIDAAAMAVTVPAYLADLAPTIFGTASGGSRWSSAGFAAAATLQTASLILSRNAERNLMSEQYRRRRVEWQFLARQAEQDLEAMDLQIEVQDIAITAAKTSLDQATKAQEQAQAYYTFLKSRTTGPALYQWLLGQMSTLYFQAYDVVLSMCLGTEACWQYEVGDRDTRFIPVNAWADNRHGLTAGEMLKLGLLQMESAFLSRHERRLELNKTISLKALLKHYDPGADALEQVPRLTGWEAVMEELRTTGAIGFDLPASLFDKDYPGHYLRQLVRVSVSIPAVLGPYEDVRVLLEQQSSSVLLSPDIRGVRYLYKKAGELPEPADDIDPTHIVFNPRANQQIGISGGVDDHGMFMLDFGDERYFPFEGTGAVSRWLLSFPRHESERQNAVLDSLTDIILHVRYLAVDGGRVFNADVETLVRAVEEDEATRLIR